MPCSVNIRPTTSTHCMVCFCRYSQHRWVLWVCLLPLLQAQESATPASTTWMGRGTGHQRGRRSPSLGRFLGTAAQSHSCPDLVLRRDLLCAGVGDLQGALLTPGAAGSCVTLHVTLGSALTPSQSVHGGTRGGVCTPHCLRCTGSCPRCSPPLP